MPSATRLSHNLGPTRCEELWFEDGNIVIESSHRLFRVYRNTLADISPVFQERFSSANLTQSTGCHTLRLEHDSNDLELFLKAIFLPDYYADKMKSSSGVIDFTVLSAVLRMSTQFGAHRLRKRSVAQLIAICPTSLQVYDMNRTTFAATNLPSDQLPCAITKLGRETDVTAVLPFAMYSCSTQPLHVLLDGELEWEDKKACIVARQDFSSYLRGSMFGFLLGRAGEGGSSECRSPTSCTLERLAFLNRREDSFSSGSKGPLDCEVDWRAVEKLFCGPCSIAFRSSFELAREEFWDDLPNILGLPPWHSLLSTGTR